MAKRDAGATPSIQSLGRGLSILEAVAESSEPVPVPSGQLFAGDGGNLPRA